MYGVAGNFAVNCLARCVNWQVARSHEGRTVARTLVRAVWKIWRKRGLKPESTDKDVMKWKDRLGDGSANWQFAPLDQRSLCQAQALSSVASAAINVR